MAPQKHPKCCGQFSCLFGFRFIRFNSIEKMKGVWVNLAQKRYLTMQFSVPPGKRALKNKIPEKNQFF